MLEDIPSVVLSNLLIYLNDSDFANLLRVSKSLKNNIELAGEWRKRCQKCGFCFNDFTKIGQMHLSSVALTPDCKYLLCTDRTSINVHFRENRKNVPSKGGVKRLRVQLDSPLDDLCRFSVVSNENVAGYLVASGTASGSLVVWRLMENLQKFTNKNKCGRIPMTPCAIEMGAHSMDIHDTDMTQVGEKILIATSSKDTSFGLFEMQEPYRAVKKLLNFSLEERLWSCAFNPHDATQLCLGTAGIHSHPMHFPIHLARIDPSGCKIVSVQKCPVQNDLQNNVRKGTSAYSICWWDRNCLLSSGHEASVRCWDFRSNEWFVWVDLTAFSGVWKWDDPFDSTLTCVKTDGKSVLTGSSRYSVLWMLDMRAGLKQRRGVYLAKERSPVYSVAFAYDKIYASLGESVVELGFQFPCEIPDL